MAVGMAFRDGVARMGFVGPGAGLAECGVVRPAIGHAGPALRGSDKRVGTASRCGPERARAEEAHLGGGVDGEGPLVTVHGVAGPGWAEGLRGPLGQLVLAVQLVKG